VNGHPPADEWSPGVPKANPYNRVDQSTSWELFDKSNRYYEHAQRERGVHPQYADFLTTSARELRAAAAYILTLHNPVN
jgi:hypothetical protein